MKEYKFRDILYIDDISAEVNNILLKLNALKNKVKSFYEDINEFYKNIKEINKSIENLSSFGIEDIRPMWPEGALIRQLDLRDAATNGTLIDGILYPITPVSVSVDVTTDVEGKVVVDDNTVEIDDVMKQTFYANGRIRFLSDGRSFLTDSSDPRNIVDEDFSKASVQWFVIPREYNGHTYGIVNVDFVWYLTFLKPIYLREFYIYSDDEIKNVSIDNNDYPFETMSDKYIVRVNDICRTIKVVVEGEK